MTSRAKTSLLPLADSDLWPDELRRSLSDRFFTIAFGAIQWPWLLRSLSGGKRADKARLMADLGLAADALPNLGSWKADTGYLSLIVDQIADSRPHTVVELGTGASSLVTGAALAKHGGGQLISFDQHAGFVDATREWLAEHGIAADLRAAPLVEAPGDWPGVWYDIDALPDQVDLLLIDGPPWTIHPYVRGAAETLFARLPIGGVVMLDDGARPGERVVAQRWRRRWPNFHFELVNRGTKGTLIGRRLT